MIDGVNLITTETICISGGFLSNLIPAIIAALGCIVAIIVSIFGLASTFYIVISMFWILGVKIVRRIKHGTPLYD